MFFCHIMSISAELLSQLQNSIYVSNGTQVVNIDGPRGFTAKCTTPRILSGVPRVFFDSLVYDHPTFNLNQQLKLNSYGHFIIEPAAYSRTLTLHIDWWTGVAEREVIINLIFSVFVPTAEKNGTGEAEDRLLARIQQPQTTTINKQFYNLSFLIPKNAYDFRLEMGTSPDSTALHALTIHGILSA